MLFSGNKASEQFLLQVQSLLVSSHYRNSPDDLQVLADAPAHHLFALLPPIPADGNVKQLPSVLCIVQVCRVLCVVQVCRVLCVVQVCRVLCVVQVCRVLCTMLIMILVPSK